MLAFLALLSPGVMGKLVMAVSKLDWIEDWLTQISFVRFLLLLATFITLTLITTPFLSIIINPMLLEVLILKF